MAIRFYDEAIANKIQKWIKDPNLRILKPDETNRLFKLRASQTDDKPITLPLIALSRDTSFEILNTNKNPMSFNGNYLDRQSDRTAQLNAIPIELNYQLDIYTKEYEVGDEYLRDFIFHFINNGAIKIIIPYNGVNEEHIAYLKINSTVTDNSDIPEKLFPDQFTRWTIQFTLKDAYLWSVPINKNWKISDAELRIINKNNGEVIVEEEKVDIDLHS